MMSDEKLTIKETASIIVEAGLNALPVAGGSLATLYFGVKQEKKFKRLERFYNELQSRLNKIEKLDISQADKGALASIIEEINEAVEEDFTENRLKYFQNCFLNSLQPGGEKQYDKKRYFISKLARLSDIDMQVLVHLYKAPEDHVFNYAKEEEWAGDFNAALERMKSDGFIGSKLSASLIPGIDWGEVNGYYISKFGKEFVEYCLAVKQGDGVRLTVDSD
ncbi:hypothetical protein MPV89_004573 [Vibrio vulnificus]|nr:hypothetical protein [Vibrio vulnificus]EIZ4670324.1 hypothetical protein [Vibrio vulnificus]HDY7695075.1 hypothetical protein [Vibrio vulnificus]HDY7809567.1 hypothetical protein [Vibrio vulnificus]